MELVTLKLQGLNPDKVDSSKWQNIILGISGIELVDYDPNQNEAVIVCQNNNIDNLILRILEAGLGFKRYSLEVTE